MSYTKKVFIGVAVFFAAIIIVSIATAGHKHPTANKATVTPTATAPTAPSQPSTTPPATQAPPPPATTQAPAQDTVTFEITGNAPNGVVQPTFTYGPAGSTYTGYVGLDKTQPIPSTPPSYYAINAQLSDAGGNITVKILVDGKVVSQGNTSSADGIATAEIVQNPITSTWQDVNS